MIIALALITSCGPVPRPFQSSDTEKAFQPLVKAPVIAPILVAPIDPSLPNGPELAEAAAELLRQNGLVASANPDLANAFLLMIRDDGRTLAWELFTREGDPLLFLRTQKQAQTTAKLQSQEPPTESPRIEIGDVTALISPLAKALGVSDPIGSLETTPLTLAIGTVTGAPGDGNRALAKAIKATLARNTDALRQEGSASDLILEGGVSTQKLDAETDLLRIDWIVRRIEGEILAEMSQENPISRAAIEGAWGGLAWDIALAAAPDILRILSATNAAR